MSKKQSKLSILGIILFIVGAAAFGYAQYVINDNWTYTWSAPYTDFELTYVIMNWAGIAVAVAGILAVVIKGLRAPAAPANTQTQPEEKE